MTSATTPSPLEGLEGRWRTELMDLGGPNTLVWPRRDGSEVVDLTRAHPGGIAMLLAGRDVRLGDLVREPEARARAQRAARLLRERADLIAEEHGLATCFLAMGEATWHTSDEGRVPAAPVLLRRVDLEPMDGGDLRLTFVADVELNPALVTVLDRRLRRPGQLARILERGRSERGFNPEPVLEALRKLGAQIPGFEVTTSLRLGAFPYGKAESIADLDAMERAIAAHPVIARLAGDVEPTAKGRPVARRSRWGGAARAPERVEASVFDLPEDQQGALDLIAEGEDVFVEAPPGVDAARFVAATVAQTVGDGRRVLVVAEKTAALTAVREALASIGLGDLVLHITDPAAQVDPRIITERWPDRADQPEAGSAASRQRAADAAAILDGHAQAVHTPREPWGVSIADAQDSVVALAGSAVPPRSRVRLPRDVLCRLDLDAIVEASPRAEAVARTFAWAGRPGAVGQSTPPSPWWRGRVTSAHDVDWVAQTITSLLDRDLSALDTTMTEVFRDITEPRAQSPGDHGRFLAAVEQIRDTLDVFRPELFDAPIDPLIDATSATTRLGMVERRRLARQARSYLRPGRPPADLHAALVTAQEQRRSWAQIVGGGGRPRIPATIDSAHDAYERVHAALDSIETALPVEAGRGPLVDRPTGELRTLLAALLRDRSGAEAAATTRSEVDALDEQGLGDVLDDMARRRVPPEAVTDELRYVWWMSVLDEIGQGDDRFRAVDGTDLDGALEEFVVADAETVAANARALVDEAGRRFRSLGRGNRRAALDVDRTAKGRGKAAPRWRDAYDAWGGLLRAAGPCTMLSPLAVGLVLPPDERFDLVVVDDASRTSLARVVGAVARGGQLVVVGDPTQQRPASWTTDPAVRPASRAPDLATVAASELEVATLRTSGDPRPWLPSTAERGVVHTPAPGGDPRPRLRTVGAGRDAGDPGLEVDLVASIVLEALADPTSSLGVVTFDEEHARQVRTAVGDAVRLRPELTEAMASLPAPFVVKPADRWQREQRDRVIVSVGPVSPPGSGAPATAASRVLAGAEGVRLVGIVLTRGRRQVDWVTGLSPAGLRGAPTGSGMEALRSILTELESLDQGQRPARATGEPGEVGALVVGFVERLRTAGLVAEVGVGRAAHRVDIAVADPDYRGYQLAVSLDGPEYASRAGARQRDRILPGSLTALGWRHLRLWTTDIFADPARQEAKVLRALHEACRAIDESRGR